MPKGWIFYAVHGSVAVYLEFKNAARDIDRARQVATGVFTRFAYVYDRRAFSLKSDELIGIDLFYIRFGCIDKILGS